MNLDAIVRRAAAVLAMLALAGCAANLSRVETGEVLVGQRLAVKVDSPWNRFDGGPALAAPTWTVDGLMVDGLSFYVGIKDGTSLAPTISKQPNRPALIFKASMQPAEVVALFESLMTADGSKFSVERIEPTDFVGTRGFRFEYALIRKRDDVRLRGVGWGAVRQGELFAIVYAAPRLSFFDRHAAKVEALARSANIRS